MLRHFVFGNSFLSWVQVLYGNANGLVKVNGQLTLSFPLTRPIRQGCLPSFFLLTSVAEPLATLINSNTDTHCTPETGEDCPVRRRSLLVRNMESLRVALSDVSVSCRASCATVHLFLYLGLGAAESMQRCWKETLGKISPCGG